MNEVNKSTDNDAVISGGCAASEMTSGDVTSVDKPKDEESAFAYLDRDNFTSEKFKLEIRNLPKYYGMMELKKLINKKLNLDASKIKRPHGGASWVYACFRSDASRQSAREALSNYQWKGQTLRISEASAVPDPLVLKRQNAGDERDDRKRVKLDENVDLSEMLKNATMPLWNKSYSDQLELKEKNSRDLLKKLAIQLVRENPSLKGWLDEQRRKYDGLPCEMLPIRKSPIVDGYRNKCEFSIGINEQTGKKTVGMRLGSYAEGSLCVVSPDSVTHIPDVMKKVVSIVQPFIEESTFDVYNQETHTGYWKCLTARYGFRTQELMLVFTISRQSLSEDELKEIGNQLCNLFNSEKASEVKVNSLHLAITDRGQTPINILHLMGDAYIHEKVCGYTFRISPQAFFQINTEAADVLYETIAELSQLCEDTTLIDVCCGAGTIGICLSKYCGEVLGLEMNEEAVQDAKRNVEVNEIKNATFFAGKAESILSSVIYRSTKKKIVAVVDPPRAGLERSAIVQLRRTKNIERFVYASCNPNLALKNFIDFGRAQSKQYKNDPFVPVRCVPVDMFPHTNSYELVIIFERLRSNPEN